LVASLGVILHDKGDLNSADNSYRRAIELDPTDGEAHNNLGIVLQAKGDLIGAEKCWRRAIEIDPKDASARKNLGTFLFEKADALEATGGDPKAMGRLYLEAADHWEVPFGAQDSNVVAARKKAASAAPRFSLK
jgi:Flp pilus assembly protein TadD